MTSDCIYIKICSSESMCLSNLKIKLEDKCNEIVFDRITDDFGKVKIPVCNNKYINYSYILIYRF